MPKVPVIRLDHLTPAQRKAYLIADNQLTIAGGWDRELLALEVVELDEAGFELPVLGLGELETENLLELGRGGKAKALQASGSLARRFLFPPFSVLDSRTGAWQERKAAWLDLGIRSEIGREGNLLKTSRMLKRKLKQRDGTFWTGTSVFDPVICELAYRWFSPEGAAVLDPFAGGSVRGIVAARLGRKYHGVDLRGEQVAANREQWGELEKRGLAVCASPTVESQLEAKDLTPVELHAGHLVKRDDLFSVAGVCGGKVRTCWHLAEGAEGLVTAGSRSSPQANIVAHVAKALGIPSRIHTPEGELSPELLAAQAAGAEVVQHQAGRNSVIVSRARKDAEESAWREIPFGMECQEAVEATAAQVANLPWGKFRRLVVPVGSGMSLAGILHGLARAGQSELPVLGVRVGADPEKRLDRYAPEGWRSQVELVKSGHKYDELVEASLGTLQLDPVYEAKALEHLAEGDLFWIVGIRQTREEQLLEHQAPAPRWEEGDGLEARELYQGEAFDFLFSCPPYGDLEVYSDDPRDLSNMSWQAFLAAYREIIKRAVAMLKEDRFACFVVGEIRDRDGAYRRLVGETVEAFEAAGARYYNELVHVMPVGGRRFMAGNHFQAARKISRMHQSVLVFCKGDAKKATLALGELDMSAGLDEAEGLEG